MQPMKKPNLKLCKIVESLAMGYSAHEIGDQLYLSPRTIQVYLNDAHSTYNVNNSGGLIGVFIIEKWIHLSNLSYKYFKWRN